MKRLQSLGLFSLLSLMLAAMLTTAASAQIQIVVPKHDPVPVAKGNNLYCAGYIQSSSISTANRIVGAQDEADKYNYSQNDFMYVNMGQDKGVRVGDTFSVVRPRGSVKSKWSNKNDLGFFVQEVGWLQVVDVKPSVSVAKVKWSCDAFYLGDLVQLSETRISPISMPGLPLNRFADATGKASGHILMTRDGAEMLGRDSIAYVDLGADNQVKVGDKLTVFRSLERGNINTLPQHEIISSRDYGFESDRYKGGKFSNQSPRKEGDHAGGKEVKTAMAKEGRPYLRKVVGEAVVLNVREKTATVVITRNAQEIHTGDQVEIQ